MPSRSSICPIAMIWLLVSAPSVAAQDDVAQRLRQAGIRPVEPPTSAVDLSLSRLEGGSQELSAYYGDWLVLTFFASWCAPCLSELPTLQRLESALQGDGVSVVGLSIDSDRQALERLVGDLALELEILWDDQGEAARRYRAASIPLSYLVDPTGRVVGVSRGARDWSALEGLFRELLRIRPPGRGEPSAYDPDLAEVSLPIKLTPPTASLALDPPRPVAGEPFHLDVRIQWAGNFEEYLLHPPHVALPEGVTELGVSARTGGEEGRSVVTYRVALEAGEAGAYALDPVELRYTPRFESAPVSSRIEGPTVEILARTLLGLAPATLGLVAVTALVLVGGGWFAVSRRRQSTGVTEPDPVLSIQAALDEARRLRVEGAPAEAFERLVALELELVGEGSDSAERRRELGEWRERVRFGGEIPSGEALDRLHRRVELHLKELKPDPRNGLPEGVRLRRASAGFAQRTASEREEES